MKLKLGHFFVRYEDGLEDMFYGLYDENLVVDHRPDWEVDVVPPDAMIFRDPTNMNLGKLEQIVDFWNRTR